MLILIIGVALWSAAHLFRRIAPQAWRNMGATARPMVTAMLILSIFLMIWGYRGAEGAVFWGPSPALKGINNLMVLIGIYLFAASGMKTGITKHLRNPQLVGFSLWAAAHIVANGDVPSFVLFGGLLCWALLEMALIGRDGAWQRPAHAVPIRKEGIAIVASLVVFAVVGAIHAWLGYNPFGA